MTGTPIAVLYGRQVVCRLVQPTGEARELKGLRIRWSSKKSASKQPATCTIEIFNPAPETRSLVENRETLVEIWAGYSGQDPNGALNPTRVGIPRLVWRGNPIKYGVKFESQPPDKVLTIETSDGANFNSNKRVKISFSTQTTPAQIIQEALRQTEVPYDPTAWPTTPVYPGGFTFTGRVSDLFTQIAATTENEWYIRDGAFVWAGFGSATAIGVIVSPSTGLIGSPSPKDDGSVEMTVLLNPSIRVGSLLFVESSNTNGSYVVKSIEMNCDSGFSNEFYMNVTASRVK